MTRYTVSWSNQAQNQLARLWTDAADRQAVTDAANAIDALLSRDPLTKGTTLTEGMRAPEVPALRVLFVVQEPDRLVRVALVRRMDPPSSPPSADGDGQRTNQPP